MFSKCMLIYADLRDGDGERGKCHTLDTKWVMVLVKEYEWHHSHDFDYCLAAVFYGGIFHMLQYLLNSWDILDDVKINGWTG